MKIEFEPKKQPPSTRSGFYKMKGNADVLYIVDATRADSPAIVMSLSHGVLMISTSTNARIMEEGYKIEGTVTLVSE